MSTRPLSPRALNKALLARQLLLERSGGSIVDTLEQMGGLQMQYAPSGYIGLWSRMHHFRRDRLTAALQERTVVQGWAMRATIHLLSPGDFQLFNAGVRRSRREWWLRTQRTQLEGVDTDAAAALVRRALHDGPRRHAELAELLQDHGFPRIAWQGIGIDIDLVRVPPSGTWEHRRADLYALADEWIGPNGATEEEGLRHLVVRYLGGFGPAPARDIASWAGVPVSTLQPVLEQLDLHQYTDDSGTQLLDVPGAPLPGPDAPAPVRLLPTWDAMLLVHARRTQVLPEQFRSRVFSSKNPQSVSTVLIDGAVAGTWRVRGDEVSVEYFVDPPAAIRRQVDAEVDAIGELFA